MLNHILNLSDEEKALILNAPLYVSLLIAGADGHIDSDEKNRAIELIHTKTFSERYELREMYKTLDHNAAEEIRKMIAALPENTDERNKFLSDMLARLNNLFPKLDQSFAISLYENLRQFAHYVATSDGGWWGVGSVGPAEKVYVKLPMLNNPAESAE
jgi:tellurite resistance protein